MVASEKSSTDEKLAKTEGASKPAVEKVESNDEYWGHRRDRRSTGEVVLARETAAGAQRVHTGTPIDNAPLDRSYWHDRQQARLGY